MKIKKDFIVECILSDGPVFTKAYMYTAIPRMAAYTFDSSNFDAQSRYYELYRFDIDSVDFESGIFNPKKRPFFCGFYNSMGDRL